MVFYKFFHLSKSEKRIFFEAGYKTLLVRIVTTLYNTRKYASWLGQQHVETDTIEPTIQVREEILQVKKAMSRCRYLVWARKCLVEAIAAKRMLDRRNIPATLYMGVAKDKNGKMIAHAWLRSGNIWITGGRNRHGFTVVGIFS